MVHLFHGMMGWNPGWKGRFQSRMFIMYKYHCHGCVHELILSHIHSRIIILGADDYVFESLVPLIVETHGGEDVGIYASGPMAHLFRGVVEQNVIAHVMATASCVGPDYEDCGWNKPDPTPVPPATCGASTIGVSVLVVVVAVFVRLLY